MRPQLVLFTLATCILCASGAVLAQADDEAGEAAPSSLDFASNLDLESAEQKVSVLTIPVG